MEAGNEDAVADLNDQNPGKCWVWELRQLQSLPRHLQPQAKALKAGLHEVWPALKFFLFLSCR